MAARKRLLVALGIGLAGGALCFLQLSLRGRLAADFTWPWRAAQLLLEGQNPYRAIQPTGEYPFQAPFFYPLPAALLALPFSLLSSTLAGALFFGLGSGLLAYASAGDGWGRLPLFLSAPYLVAAAVAQWSPLIVAAALLPSFQWLLAAKPNIGLASFIYRPTKRGALLLAAFLALSLAALPAWPLDWLRAVAGLEGHPPPALIFPLGTLLLLSALHWRRAEGRLILALALVPQLLFFYDQLPLWLVPRSAKGSWALTGLSWLAYLLWRLFGTDLRTGEMQATPEGYVLALIYLPALALALWPQGRGLPDLAASARERLPRRGSPRRNEKPPGGG